MKATYKIDSAHSSANFSIRHLMISNVRGGFSKIEGTVEYDPDNPTSSTIEAEIDAASIKTNDDQRDAHLKSADFLDVEKYPSITFKSTRIAVDGDGEATVDGNLTIHGVTRPVTLKVEGPTPEGKDPWGNTRIGASATTKIKRGEFGLTFNAALETGGFMIGDDLKLEIEVELIKAAAATT